MHSTALIFCLFPNRNVFSMDTVPQAHVPACRIPYSACLAATVSIIHFASQPFLNPKPQKKHTHTHTHSPPLQLDINLSSNTPPATHSSVTCFRVLGMGSIATFTLHVPVVYSPPCLSLHHPFALMTLTPLQHSVFKAFKFSRASATICDPPYTLQSPCRTLRHLPFSNSPSPSVFALNYTLQSSHRCHHHLSSLR
jgi:hypothetical protein